MSLRPFVSAMRAASSNYPTASLQEGSRDKDLQGASEADLHVIEFRQIGSEILKIFAQDFFGHKRRIPFSFEKDKKDKYEWCEHRVASILESNLTQFIQGHLISNGGKVPEPVRQRFMHLFKTGHRNNGSVYQVFEGGLSLSMSLVWGILRYAEAAYLDQLELDDIPHERWKELAQSVYDIIISMVQNKGEVNAVVRDRILESDTSDISNYAKVKPGVISVIAKGTGQTPISVSEPIELSIDPLVYQNLDERTLRPGVSAYRTRCVAAVSNVEISGDKTSFIQALLDWMLDAYEAQRFQN